MNKNEIQWFYPSFDENEKKKLLELVDTNYLNEGKVTLRFERLLADYLGVKYAVATTSGTAAITLALLSLNIGYGDEVIVPNFTFIATANAVSFCGASVKFVDINENDFLINTEILEKSISQKTKAVIAVDVNGRGCDYKNLEKICKRKKLSLICDSAEAIGSKYKDKFLGTFGDVGCFSFSAAKTLSTGQGGLVVTNRKNLYYRLLELKDQGRRYRGTGGNDKHPSIGFNFKYTDLQATIGIEQFKKLKKRIKLFHERDKNYFNNLKNINEIQIPPKKEGEVLQWFDIIVKKNKRALLKFMKKNHIGYREFWEPLNSQKAYKHFDQIYYNTSYVSKAGLWLPSNFDLCKKTIDFISKKLVDFYAS